MRFGSLIYLGSSLSLLLTAGYAVAEDKKASASLSSWIRPEKIAIEPVLLRSDKLEDEEIEALLRLRTY